MILLSPAFGERVPPGPTSDILTVAVLPQGRYAPSTIQEMTREAAGILKHSGLQIKWRVGFERQVYDEPLAIVKLTGTCSMDLSATAGKPGPLGWTHSVDGALLPFSELACDNIRRAIESEMRADDWPKANALLGRAMGRVLAHELYHIVAATQKHTSAGISQSALSPAELLADRLELDAVGVDLIEQRVHGAR